MNDNPYIVGSQLDGNIAIKCNYCDGGKDADHIGFSGVCSDRTIRYNIEVEHRVWCSNEQCPCFQYYNGRITRDRLNQIMATPSDFVCYESTMLSDWMTQAGLTEDGQTTKHFGSSLHKGAACVFTTRLPDMDEEDRFVFGIFIVDELFRGDDRKSGYVKCNTDYHIELTPNEARQLRFWNYYRNKNNPDKAQWGTGLYRFISNNGIIALLNDLIKLRENGNQEEVIRFLKEFCRQNNIKIDELPSVPRAYSDDAGSIVSFSCGGTYDLVMETNVHAHPVKKGFPSKVSPYLMVRATGGYSDSLYKVIDTVEINPLDKTVVDQLSAEYESVKRYINKRVTTFGFNNAPLPYRFYLLKKVYSFKPAYVMNPNPQGFRYLSFEDVGIQSLDVIEEKNHVVPTRDTFIDSLNLPQGFEAKRYDGMNRVHFKYLGIGFAVIDMKVDNYNLGSRESYMDDIGVIDYTTTQNLGPNHALLKNIPYDDTSVLYKLFGYVSGNAVNPDDFEERQIKLEDQSIEEEISESHLVGTDKVAVVKARVNQGVFRDRLIRKYHKCCLCGTDEESLLVASHIKPWVDSSPEERVDVNNGLLLCPNHDKLFDRGYISFDDDGRIIISRVLSENNRVFLNVDPDFSIELKDLGKVYMKYHREKIFIDRADDESFIESIEDEDEDMDSEEESSITPLQATKLGPLPDSLIGFEVEHVGYGDGVIKSIDSRSFQIEVKFEDHEEPKTFVFPGCFLSGKLILKNDEDQLGLEDHLKKYKS